jgi:hypothetical protein
VGPARVFGAEVIVAFVLILVITAQRMAIADSTTGG